MFSESNPIERYDNTSCTPKWTQEWSNALPQIPDPSIPVPILQKPVEIRISLLL